LRNREKERFMEGFLNKVHQISRIINVFAGISITFIVLLTVADVILGIFRRPIAGTYELVGFSGAIVVGFAIPLTSWMRSHIFVDFFVQKFSQGVQRVFNVATRCIGIVLFFLIAWNLIKVGIDIQKSGEVSPTLHLPFYPVAYAVGVVCFFQCLVLFCDIVKIFGGKYE
jgi:TRAP-type C4-dicarboxylate transport system permease small subunit